MVNAKRTNQLRRHDWQTIKPGWDAFPRGQSGEGGILFHTVCFRISHPIFNGIRMVMVGKGEQNLRCNRVFATFHE